MKDQSTIWIIISFIIYLLTTEITANFHYKFRRMPLPPRIVLSPKFMKTKWQNNLRLPRPHVRPTTFSGVPLQKYPIYFYPLKASIPFIMPLNTRIHPVINFQTLENNKPFYSNLLNKHVSEYEFRNENPILEQNKEPIISTISQNDDQGPIHTIPAPNLSSELKPVIVEDVKSAEIIPTNYPQSQNNHLIFGNNDKIIRNPLTGQYVQFAPDPDPPLLVPKKSSFELSPVTTHNNNVNNNNIINNLSAIKNDVSIGSLPTSELSSFELLQLLNTYSQQQLVDSYGMPLAQQPQLQQHILQHQNSQQNHSPEHQLLNQKLFNPSESNFLSQIHEAAVQNEPIKFKEHQPQYHSFNYEEQQQQNVRGNNFVLPQNDFIVPKNNIHLSKIQNDNLYFINNPNNNQQLLSTQQNINNYNNNNNNIFGSREQINTYEHYENNEQNNFQNNQNISTSHPELNNNVYNEEIPSVYTTLPSTNDAETLPFFQNSEDININDNVFKHTHRVNKFQVQPEQVEVNTPMTIYVPDEDYEDIETQVNDENRLEYNKNNIHETTINQNAEEHRDKTVSSDYDDSNEGNIARNPHWNDRYVKNKQDNSETISNSYETQSNVPFGTRLKLKSNVRS